MMPPTSIDGTDITGATIDGTDVQEITVDGDTVFTAETLPVAYSNLIIWTPFDSSFYGGSNADDVTALFNPGEAGDSTAFDGTVNGSTYASSGGVKDINAGATSGAFDFDGSNDIIDFGTGPSTVSAGDFSICLWAKADAYPTNTDDGNYAFCYGGGLIEMGRVQAVTDLRVRIFDGSVNDVVLGSLVTGTYIHLTLTYDSASNTMEGYLDGVSQGTNSSGSPSSGAEYALGAHNAPKRHWDGEIDDWRLYDKVLSSSEVNQIYQNTKP